MLTQLYTTEEDPALCSIIWGGNFTVTPVVHENDSQAITAASTSHNIISSGASETFVDNRVSAAAAATAAGSFINGATAVGNIVTNNAGSISVGDNLRDDLYITNEVSLKEIKI